jgi:hypothetical protein
VSRPPRLRENQPSDDGADVAVTRVAEEGVDVATVGAADAGGDDGVVKLARSRYRPRNKRE